MSKFTKGPWRSDAYGVITGEHPLTSIATTYKQRWATCQAEAGRRGKQDVADYCGEMHDEADANARLIAASPELLEACTKAHEALLALHVCNPSSFADKIRANLKAVIAKATE